MKKHDMKAICEFIRKELETNGKRDFYKVSEFIENGVEVESELKNRPHKFSCGTDGEVVDELTIKIKFKKDFNIQPHNDFEEELVAQFIKDPLYDEVFGYFDSMQ